MKLLKTVDFSDIKEGEIFAITRDCCYLIKDDIIFPKYKSIKKIEIYCKKKKYGHWHNVIFLADDWDDTFANNFDCSHDGGEPGKSFYLSNNDCINKLHKNTQKLWGIKEG